MSYKGQVLRGEKWFHLMTEKEIAKDADKAAEVAVYLESKKKVEAKKEEKPKKEAK